MADQLLQLPGLHQLRHIAVEVGQIGYAFLVVVVRVAAEHLLEKLLPSPLPAMVEAYIARNRIEPGPKRALALERVQGPERPQKDLLGQVVGLLIADHPADKSKDRRLVFPEQRFEGAAIACRPVTAQHGRIRINGNGSQGLLIADSTDTGGRKK